MQHRRFRSHLRQVGQRDGKTLAGSPSGETGVDDDIARVATREAYEESGLEALQLVSSEIFDLDVHLIPERGNEPAHYHYDVRYLFECAGDPALTVSEESNELAWAALSAIETYTSEDSILRMVRKTG